MTLEHALVNYMRHGYPLDTLVVVDYLDSNFHQINAEYMSINELLTNYDIDYITEPNSETGFSRGTYMIVTSWAADYNMPVIEVSLIDMTPEDFNFTYKEPESAYETYTDSIQCMRAGLN